MYWRSPAPWLRARPSARLSRRLSPGSCYRPASTPSAADASPTEIRARPIPVPYDTDSWSAASSLFTRAEPGTRHRRGTPRHLSLRALACAKGNSFPDLQPTSRWFSSRRPRRAPSTYARGVSPPRSSPPSLISKPSRMGSGLRSHVKGWPARLSPSRAKGRRQVSARSRGGSPSPDGRSPTSPPSVRAPFDEPGRRSAEVPRPSDGPGGRRTSRVTPCCLSLWGTRRLRSDQR